MAPAKHAARSLGPARIILSGAASVLVMLIVWIAVRAVGPAEAAREPTLVLPSLVPSSASSPTPSPSATTASASPTVTKRTSVPEKTTTKPRTAKPTATKTTTRPRTDDFAATVSLGASWEQGYVATVRVRNTGRSATAWKVTVSHSGQENLRLTGVWNARGTQSGDNIAFTGDRLAPGASVQFGYQVSKSGRGNAKPSGCSVVGGKCSVG